MRRYNRDIIRKWGPIINKQLEVDETSDLCALICHKIDKISIIAQNNIDVPQFILDIRPKLNENRFKKKIVGTFFNTITNKKGYILEDGQFRNKNVTNLVSSDDIVYLFGLDTLKEIDPEEFIFYRDKKLETILDENR